MGDVLDLNGRLLNKHLDEVPVTDRVQECFWHSMFGESKDCEYCIYRSKAAKTIFEILMSEMIKVAQTTKLNLTNADAELVLMEAMENLRQYNEYVEAQIGQRETDQSPPKETLGSLSGITWRKSTAEKADQTTSEDLEQENPNGGND